MQAKHSSYMTGFKPVLLVITLLFAISCQKSERIFLDIDFENAKSWHYLLGVDIKGKVTPDSIPQLFSSSLRTYLQGGISPGNKKVITLKTEQTRINSDFLVEQEIRNLEQQFDNVSLLFSPKDGALNLIDTTDMPVVNIGGWDLFRSFAKVLPVFPEAPVGPGDKWDRDRQFPIQTNHGDAIGHLYQSFIFDSVYQSTSRFAAVSWKFSYRIELINPDTSGTLDNLPQAGRGTGRVLLDLTSKRISSAHAEFDVPITDDYPGMSWKEVVHMEIIE